MIDEANNFLWVEKYRPKTIERCILPKALKQRLQAYVKEGNLPNLLFCGTSGIGKTTVARALVGDIGADYKLINGSLNAGIDVLRNDIHQFVSTVSFEGGRKYVILDEADYLNPNSVQPALRNFMEEFSRNAGFIFTANYRSRITDALISRVAVEDFSISKEEESSILSQQCVRIMEILKHESVKVESPKVILELVKKHFPDFRRCINELQKYALSSGVIDSGLLASSVGIHRNYAGLLEAMRNKNFTAARQWVADNADVDNGEFFDTLHKMLRDVLRPSSLMEVIVLLAKYQYQAAFAAVKDINMIAAIADVMQAAQWEG